MLLCVQAYKVTIKQSKNKSTVPKRQESKESLPDLNDKDVQEAATKIQSVFRGFQTRKEKEKSEQKRAKGKAKKSQLKITVMIWGHSRWLSSLKKPKQFKQNPQTLISSWLGILVDLNQKNRKIKPCLSESCVLP